MSVKDFIGGLLALAVILPVSMLIVTLAALIMVAGIMEGFYRD